jgi:hypothetical protein
MTWRGAYVTGTAYAVGDGVESGGSSYVAIAPVQGFCGINGGGGGCTDPNAPPNPTFWSLVAAKGADGAQGPQGEQGQQGPRGPSDAYHASSGAVFLDGNWTSMATLSLPAGSYVVQTDAAANTIGGAGYVACELVAPGNAILDSAGAATNAYFPLLGWYAGGAATLTVQCAALSGPAGAIYSQVHVVAIAVGALH